MIKNLNKLKSDTKLIGNYFQCLEEKKALILMQTYTEELYSFYLELSNQKKYNIENEVFLMLNNSFNNIVESIKKEDYISLGDIFIYELLPTLQRIEEQ